MPYYVDMYTDPELICPRCNTGSPGVMFEEPDDDN